MARKEAMKKIEEALAPSDTGEEEKIEWSGPPTVLPPSSPVSVSPEPETEKPEPGALESAQKSLLRQREERLQRKEERLQRQYEDSGKTEEQVDQAKIWNRIITQAGNIWDDSKVKLESLPTPGDIAFPLIVLLIFFFLLIPVNGHTRLVWLWLSLIGQAEIRGSQADLVAQGGQPIPGPVPGGSVNLPQSNGTITAQPITPLVFPTLGVLGSMTGPEDFRS